MRHFPQLAIITVLCACLGATEAAAGTMYRYMDDNGRMVISNTVPSDASKRGYEILNSQGRVVNVIDPAPTDEELAARAAAEERAREAKHRRQEDTKLLRSYSSPDEAVLALRRKLQELESLVQLKRGNISVVESQLEEQQSKAADLERAGREVPENLTSRIDRLQAQKRDIEQEIQQQNMETDQIRHSFEAKIKRLETITGEERTLELRPSDDSSDSSE